MQRIIGVHDTVKFFMETMARNFAKCFDDLIVDQIGDMEMPLVKGKKASSKKGFSENVRREMHEGKPQKQAVAIAYSEARRGKKGKDKKKKDPY